MQIIISGHHFTVSDGTRSYIESEAKKLEKFYAPIIDFHATLTEEGRRHKVDLVCNVHSHTFKSSGEDDKVHSSIDQAIKRMATQPKRQHDKQKEHRGDSAAKQAGG